MEVEWVTIYFSLIKFRPVDLCTDRQFYAPHVQRARFADGCANDAKLSAHVAIVGVDATRSEKRPRVLEQIYRHIAVTL